MSNWFRKHRDAANEESLPPEFVRDHPWLRQLYYEPRLRVAVAAMVLIFSCLVLWYGPVLPASSRPDGGHDWMSGRHWFGSWSAKRAALRAGAAGDAAGAARFWRRAVGHDPNCLSCEREPLSALLREMPPDRESLTNGTRHALWLLHLGKTNRADLVLFARLLLHHGEAREAVTLLEPWLATLSAPEFRVYLEACLAGRSFGKVGPAWVTVAPRVRADRTVHLYELAWRIGWGGAGEVPAARRELALAEKEAMDRGALARIGLELALWSGDSAAAEARLETLHQLGIDRVGDHLRMADLWRMAGRPELARRRLHQAPRVRSVDEALELTSLAATLGDTDVVLGTLQDAAPRLNQASLWLRWAEAEVNRGDWAAAGTVGRRIEDESQDAALLSAYTGFLKGVAAEKAGRTAEAEDAFRALRRLAAGDAQVLWLTAGQLFRFGHPREAQALLSACESQWGTRPEYWEKVHRITIALGDVDGMLASARKAWQLAPDNPARADRLAAALIAARKDPVEAVRLTLDAVSALPSDPGIRLHRALALIQMNRDDEGMALLRELETTERLNAALRTGVYLGRFEVHARRREWKAALADYQEIDSRELLPSQVLWVESQFEQVLSPPREEGGAKPLRQP